MQAPVKDRDRSGVSASNVELTDAPVVTTEVAAGSAMPAADALESIVQEAFEAHAGRLTAFARAAARDVDAADDPVQETFLRYIREVRAGAAAGQHRGLALPRARGTSP